MKKITVTIGIPAYNEEANIKQLLQKIIAQKTKTISIEKIIIISDASTDRTVEKIQSLKHPKIHVIENKVRQGKPKIQNTLFAASDSEALVILDADILPIGETFLENLVGPLRTNKTIGIVGADTKPAKPKTFIENVIADSHLFKISMYKQINNGNTIYLCHGRARAFSKTFYQQLSIPADCSQEDAYTYLTCIQKGFSFTFTKEAVILFASPTTILDHAKQSARFHQGKKGLSSDVDYNIIKKAYAIPMSLFFRHLLEFIIRQPISAVSYLTIQIYLKLFNPIKKAHKGTWYVSSSTKAVKLSQ